MSSWPIKLTLASNNQHKFVEIQQALAPNLVQLQRLEAPPNPKEDGDSFSANAIIKAQAFAAQSQTMALADDSGLEVDALNGQPGIHSARFADPSPDQDAANNALLLEKLAQAETRRARFRCVLALGPLDSPLRERLGKIDLGDASLQSQNEGEYLIISGSSEGIILRAPQGANGFGYDPLFLSEKLGITFAQASIEEKELVSHRGVALAKLSKLLRMAAKLSS